MTPRIVLRTHYQVDEPRIILRLISKCSSPTTSRSDDKVAACVKADVLGWEKRTAFGLPAANYAIGNARAFDLLNDSNRATAAGLGFLYIERGPSDPNCAFVELTTREARLFLVQYLIGTGALVLRFASWLLSKGETSDEEVGHDRVIEQLLVGALDDYLALERDVRSRTAIRRERDRLKAMTYDDKTRRHKRRPLLTTMRRLRLLDVDSDDKTIRPDKEGRLATLIHKVPTIDELERTAESRELLRGVVTKVYSKDSGGAIPASASEIAASAYEFAMAFGIQACPLSFLDDAVFANGIAVPAASSREGYAERILSDLHARLPRAVRFHVNRKGERAFVVLSAGAVEALRASQQ
jgi:hypothetical protein